MRILHCLRAPVGGLFRHVLDLASAQAARGHDVGIVVDANSSNALTEARLAEIAERLALGVIKIPMRRAPGIGDLSAACEVYGAAKSIQPEIVHGHGAKGGLYARLAAAALKARGAPARCFYTPHGGSLHYRWSTPAGAIFLSAEKALQRLTDGLIFESRYAAETYEAQIGLGAAPFRIVPNGVGEADFNVIGAAGDAADFLFIGELRFLKGVDLLIDALAAIARQRPVSAVIVGAGPDEAEFRSRAAARGLSAEVTFKGALPARQAFTLGRCLVVPSRAESLPYVVLEAAAAGKPVIASNVGGIPEIVAGTTCALVPPGDPRELEMALLRFLDEPAAATATAAQMRAAVAERYTVSAMASGVLDFYAGLRPRLPRRQWRGDGGRPINQSS